MTIFGNRDSSYGSSTPVADAVPLPSGTATPTIPARAFGAADNRRVILRIHGDESILVGSAEGRESAVRIANTPRISGSLAHRAVGGSRSKASVTISPSSSRRTATPTRVRVRIITPPGSALPPTVTAGESLRRFPRTTVDSTAPGSGGPTRPGRPSAERR